MKIQKASSRSRVWRFVPRAALMFVATVLVISATTTAVAPADPQRYLADIKALTAPSMEGRGPGTKGIERASHYLEKRYKSLGLKPAGTHGYFQPFSVITGAKLKSNNHFVVETGSAKNNLKPNQDFVPLSFSASGSAAGPLVFVGYGASADEFQYDDYAASRCKRQNCRRTPLRTCRICCEEWQHRY